MSRSPPIGSPSSCTTPKVDRTTDGHGALADLTLAEVRKLDAGSWFDPHFAGTRVPTLDEFLDVLEVSGQRALVELKGPWDEASVSSFAAAVMARGLDRRRRRVELRRGDAHVRPRRGRLRSSGSRS